MLRPLGAVLTSPAQRLVKRLTAGVHAMLQTGMRRCKRLRAAKPLYAC